MGNSQSGLYKRESPSLTLQIESLASKASKYEPGARYRDIQIDERYKSFPEFEAAKHLLGNSKVYRKTPALLKQKIRPPCVGHGH